MKQIHWLLWGAVLTLILAGFNCTIPIDPKPTPTPVINTPTPPGFSSTPVMTKTPTVTMTPDVTTETPVSTKTPTPTAIPTTQVSGTHVEVIYDDALASQFKDDCWDPAACDYQQSTTVYRGSYAGEITTGSGGWGAFGVFRRSSDWTVLYPMYPNQYKYVTFYFNPGSTFNDDKNIILTMDKDLSAPLKNYLPATVNPNQWYFVRIPFSVFNDDDSYFYRIDLFNYSGSQPHYFIDDLMLEWVDDYTPPAISNVTAEVGLTNTDTVISWTTDECTKCTVEYGIGNYNSKVSTSGYEKTGSVTVSGLQQNTTYQFKITAIDHQINSSTPANKSIYTGTFQTRPVDKTSPVISAISPYEIRSNLVRISWTTDEVADSAVACGISPASLNLTAVDAALTLTHQITVTGLTPNTVYYYTVKSKDPFNNETVSAINQFTSATQPITGDVTFQINTGQNVKDISPYIYGCNYFDQASYTKTPRTMGRLGGNRWTAYNWENNASNAGSDWYFHNDGYLSSSNTPGDAVTGSVSAIFNHNGAALVTIPILGYVAADKNGDDVRNTANYLVTRFKKCVAIKGSAFTLTPSTSDDSVYQDEFVNFLDNRFPNAKNDPLKKLFFDLDNEPDLWNSTHEAIHPAAPTYNEVVNKNIEYAKAVKNVIPQAVVFGFVSYGFNGFYNLQNSTTDFNAYGEFTDYYLKMLKQAEQTDGRRLVDVLDLHWYPEARGGGVRITDDNNSAAVAAARIQAPRSLWDTGYVEDSWITSFYGGSSIYLIRRMAQKISTNYAGTKLAFTEYYYGGGNHISGAIAQADVLGIYGREGVFAASLWPLSSNIDYINAAFNLYLNYDNNNSKFGDRSISAVTTNNDRTSIYAALDSANANRITLMAINKTGDWIDTDFNITTGLALHTGEIYQVTADSAVIKKLSSISVTGNKFIYSLAPYSITALILTP